MERCKWITIAVENLAEEKKSHTNERTNILCNKQANCHFDCAISNYFSFLYVYICIDAHSNSNKFVVEPNTSFEMSGEYETNMVYWEAMNATVKHTRCGKIDDTSLCLIYLLLDLLCDFRFNALSIGTSIGFKLKLNRMNGTITILKWCPWNQRHSHQNSIQMTLSMNYAR